MTWTPHATVAVVVEKNGRYLTVEEQSNGRVVFNQPAGHVEEQESLFDAARREALEETGYDIQLTGFLGVYTFTSPLNGVTYYRFCFTGEAISHKTHQLDEDIIAAHWLSLPELDARQDRLRSPLVMACINDYRGGRTLPLDIVQEFSNPAQDSA